MTDNGNNMNFWEHFDVLRGVLLRIAAVWFVCSLVAFCMKSVLFDIVLAPLGHDFVTYRLFDSICRIINAEPSSFLNLNLINTGLAQQFLIHVKTALCAGVIMVAPYALYETFAFVSPGLRVNERRYACRMVAGGYVMFVVGVLLSYFVIFPLTLQFLGGYQVSMTVENMITLESYMGTLLMMCLCMGVVFELPVLAWLCARAGLISAKMMTRYRRHAIVVILIAAAIITPTQDVFTLMAVALPIWLLYEVSVLIVARTRAGME